MKKTITTIGMAMLICLTVFLANGCKKEKIKGCTVSSADNFKSDAEEDDGSCSYSGNIVLWYDLATANNLNTDGITSLTYYVDGSVAGSQAANLYYTAIPNCGGSGTITISKTWTGGKTKNYSFSTKDQTATVVASMAGTATFTAKTCTAIQLTY